MEIIRNKILLIIDILSAPFTFLGAAWFSVIRRIGIKRMRLSRKIFKITGVFPIRDHYYEPLFNLEHLRYSLRKDRILTGLDFNLKEQLEILSKFKYGRELEKFPLEKNSKLEFYYHNGSFGPCDAQYLYNSIRLFKPKKIIEIGSGYSTLMAENAINANKQDELSYNCEHICIEPYECPWLENLKVRVIRKRVEELDIEIFRKLDNFDILFIDSSHVIRPQGDILFEYLEILPILKPGVLVHIHDIFTPRDYLNEWLIDEIKLWNEQYLLEAFLTFNSEYKIIASLNYLKHNYFPEISRACPILKKELDGEPCSFWIIRK
jgi:predicted O-methyltransferase YrrM